MAGPAGGEGSGEGETEVSRCRVLGDKHSAGATEHGGALSADLGRSQGSLALRTAESARLPAVGARLALA